MCAYYCEPTVGYNIDNIKHSKYGIPVIASLTGVFLNMASIYIWEAAVLL